MGARWLWRTATSRTVPSMPEEGTASTVRTQGSLLVTIIIAHKGVGASQPHVPGRESSRRDDALQRFRICSPVGCPAGTRLQTGPSGLRLQPRTRRSPQRRRRDQRPRDGRDPGTQRSRRAPIASASSPGQPRAVTSAVGTGGPEAGATGAWRAGKRALALSSRSCDGPVSRGDRGRERFGRATDCGGHEPSL